MFRVGMKVVCVAVGWKRPKSISRLRWWVLAKPKEHAIYRVVSVETLDGELGLTIAGLPIRIGKYTYGWVAYAFRPVVERPTDISIFTDMLTPARVTEGV